MSSAPEIADIVAVGVRSIEPALLPLLEPRSLRIQEAPAAAEKAEGPSVDQDATPMLSVAMATFSRWYLELKDVISRGRVFQEKYREEHRLHKNSKAPWQNPGLTDRNSGVADGMCHVVSAVFGEDVAKYAMSSFVKATETGDLRSFKIRLLMLKCRDSLKGTPLYASFASGVDNAISSAESSAGCTEYTGPRRMSRAEREKRGTKSEETRQEEDPKILEGVFGSIDNIGDIIDEASKDAMSAGEIQETEPLEKREVHQLEPTDEDLRKVEKETIEEEKAIEASECVDDEYLLEEMKAGRISPGKVWMMFDSHPPAKKGKKKGKRKNQAKFDMDQLANDVIAAETGSGDDQDEDMDAEREYDAEEDVDDEIDAQGDGSSPSEADEDQDEDDDEDDAGTSKGRRKRRRSYAELDFSDEGRVRRGCSMYGSYNASGSEWDPYAE